MGKLSEIRSDPKAMTEGLWVPFAAGIKLKIARLNNQNHLRFIAQLREKYFNDLRFADGGDLWDHVYRESLAKTILLDWKNLQDDDGKEIPYSADKALEFFENPAYVELLDFVERSARDRESYREKAKRDAVKN